MEAPNYYIDKQPLSHYYCTDVLFVFTDIYKIFCKIVRDIDYVGLWYRLCWTLNNLTFWLLVIKMDSVIFFLPYESFVKMSGSNRQALFVTSLKPFISLCELCSVTSPFQARTPLTAVQCQREAALPAWTHMQLHTQSWVNTNLCSKGSPLISHFVVVSVESCSKTHLDHICCIMHRFCCSRQHEH